MDLKPVITYSGALPLFRSLESHITTCISSDTCEWKRTYSRPVKNVRIGAQFIPFDADLLEQFKSDNWNILEYPVLHIYVTECTEVELYKSTVKEDIEKWLNLLINHGTTDWMILLVETIDMKKPKNILPRTTVLDKMRVDFGAKNVDRCISVINPIKFEIKSTESFRCLLQRLRHLVLTGYNTNIIKYQEFIRTQRERRNQENWNFVKYFLFQERLAFIFEMLGLPLEALVQYDELDAMFSQFVLNSTVGEKPKWLADFEKPLLTFHGISLLDQKRRETHQRIVQDKVTLLDFRSYVFERQISLLNSADRQWEIADRLLPFLFATLRELNTMKIETIDGSLECWQFICALEVLRLCDEAVESKKITNVFQFSAPIWNLAKDKLFALGKLCGLFPGFTPTSTQLHIVVQLSAGIGDNYTDQTADSLTKRGAKLSANEKLKEALGSNQSFQKLYLELSELAISTYKHVSRLRCARLVGLDLGNFYCTLSEPKKAIIFFSDLLHELKSENWNYLVGQTLLELASCYRKMNDPVSYTKTAGTISCCKELEQLVRSFYFDEFLQSLKTVEADDGNLLINIDDYFKLDEISIANSEQLIQDDFIVVLIRLKSNFPSAIRVEQISLSFENEKLPLTEHNTEMKNKLMLPFTCHLDYNQDNNLSTASFVCDPAKGKQTLLRRSSSTTKRKLSATTRRDFSNNVCAKDVLLHANELTTIELKAKAMRVGLWSFKQLSIVLGKFEFLSDSLKPVSAKPFEIKTQPAKVILSFENLVAGIVQPIKLIIFGGNFIFPATASIDLKCTKNLKFRIVGAASATFSSELSIRLINFKSFEEKQICLEAICELPGQRDEKHIEHIVLVHCPWSRNEVQIPLHFMPPMITSCRLHSSETRKFLQVIIKGINSKLVLSNAKMTCDCKGVNLKNINPSSLNELTVYKGVTITYLWEIDVEPLKAENELPLVKINFEIQYAHIDDTTERRNFHCKFDVQDYTTLYCVRARVEPSELCRVGSVCHLKLKIKKLQDNNFHELMYEVLADQNTWAICGRTAGVVSMQDVDVQLVTIDILPLCTGYLPMPNIRLSKYITADNKLDTHPKLLPFPPGQIYNSSKSIQIHVLANNNVES